MKTIRFLVGCMIFAILGFAGCTTAQYIETESPSGQIPAQRQKPITSVAHPKQPTTFVPPIKVIEKTASLADNSAMSLESGAHPAVSSSVVLARFKMAYTAKKNPRIAIFLNRQLSDEVREWITNSRSVLAGECSETKLVKGTQTESRNVTGCISEYTQVQAKTAARQNPDERWMWAFEDGFIQPFLGVNAKIIDRATIIRLENASAKQHENTCTPISVQKIEMNALKGYADIFVEVLISKSPSSLYGYEFKAVAKEVKTGIIVANVTSLRWHTKSYRHQEVQPTSQGYKIVDSVVLPTIDEISYNLALDLMNAMAKAWGGVKQ